MRNFFAKAPNWKYCAIHKFLRKNANTNSTQNQTTDGLLKNVHKDKLWIWYALNWLQNLQTKGQN